jgi:hypothetical protein
MASGEQLSTRVGRNFGRVESALSPLSEDPLTKVRGAKKRGDWITYYNVELHNLYSWPNIIRMIKLMRMRFSGHVERMVWRGMNVGFGWEKPKGKRTTRKHRRR